MKVVSLIAAALLVACGSASATAPTPSPTPTPTATPLYIIKTSFTHAINLLDDSTTTDDAAYYKTTAGSAAASSAASQIASDYQTLLNDLDKITFPPSADTDLATFKKAAVALQVFWSNVSIADVNYSDSVLTGLTNDYNNAGILLGHDIGLSPTLDKPSPTPS